MQSICLLVYGDQCPIDLLATRHQILGEEEVEFGVGESLKLPLGLQHYQNRDANSLKKEPIRVRFVLETSYRVGRKHPFA